MFKLLENGRVDVVLLNHETTKDIYWSPRKFREDGHPGGGLNSYVLIEGGHYAFPYHGMFVRLVCVNGAGEIRWDVPKREIQVAQDHLKAGTLKEGWDMFEMYHAAKHFGLVVEEAIVNEEYKKAAQDALNIQNASNLSGVLVALDRARTALLNRKKDLDQGTDWFNRHPIMYLFSVQLGHLTGACTFADGDYGKMNELCETLARGEKVEGL